MPVINENTLTSQIKQGAFLPVYLFYGVETYSAKKRAEQMKKKIVSDALKDFNYVRFEGTQVSISDMETATVTAPVMADKKMVLIDGLPIDKLVKEDTAKLKKMIQNVPETTVLVIMITDPEITPRSCSKLKTLVTNCAKIGASIEFAQKTDSELKKVMINHAKKLDCTLSPNVAGLIIQRQTRSLAQLLLEVEKLCAYKQGEEILNEDVYLLVSERVENSAFDLARAILRNQPKIAHKILNNLFSLQQEPLAILGALNMCFVDLYRAKCIQSAGEKPEAITDYYAYRGKEFRIRNAMRDASGYSLSQIKKCINILSDTDYICKSRAVDIQFLVEETVVKMMGV